ncbi:hypothetical protein [Melaminivora sp.]|uniref:hypothetical protein n=1 Tax=Melaminivora sp. TaxID=1933032 RepID=UPI0028B0021A|nr:hypothetical protein [Melaminivora sp.]
MANQPTAHTIPTSPQDRDPPGKPANLHGVDLTQPARKDEAQNPPRMPHERDQDVDMTSDTPDPRVQQGARDLERGLQDTDQGLQTDESRTRPRPPV